MASYTQAHLEQQRMALCQMYASSGQVLPGMYQFPEAYMQPLFGFVPPSFMQVSPPPQPLSNRLVTRGGEDSRRVPQVVSQVAAQANVSTQQTRPMQKKSTTSKAQVTRTQSIQPQPASATGVSGVNSQPSAANSLSDTDQAA